VGSMAQMVVAGNLARDVDMREAAGHPVVDVIVMVNQRLYKGKNPDGSNKYEEDVMTVSASFWRDRAGNSASLNLKKGTFVILAGNPRIRTYSRSNGDPGAEIILENAELTLGPKTDGGSGGGNGAYARPPAASLPQRQPARQAAAPAPARPAARPTGPMEAPDGADDDVPFPEDAPPASGKGGEDDW
jgi:single-strand DNA-binding protein